jgi:nucleotide-binding universal stress UspA family protein
MNGFSRGAPQRDANHKKGNAMSYKTILVHVDKSRHAVERMRIAAKIANDEQAHLIGAALTGISRFVYQAGLMGDGAGFSAQLEAHLELLREQAKECLVNFEATAKASGVASYESQLVDDEAGAGISLLGRYSDLIVIGQTDREEPAPATLPDFPEYVVMSSGRPVLVVPYAGQFESVGRRMLVAWNGSTSATRAVTNAIPLLRRADIVEVVVFNSDASGDVHGEVPGADIALYLARHDVKVNVTRQKTGIDVGNALLSIATDLGSDMIVMGGYGHSRFREILMGGVTRTVLQAMTVPVLMSH